MSDFNPVQVDTGIAAFEGVPAVPEPGRGLTAPTVELAEGDGILIPQLVGKTVREVTNNV